MEMTSEELVRTLREYADWADGEEWEVPLMLADHLRQAAESIEKLEMMYDFVSRDRDLFYKKYMQDVPRRIPVEERLPKLGDLVLVTASGKPQENLRLVNALELATLYADGWCLETWPEWQGAVVTHWMPLSKVPGVAGHA